MICSDGYLLWYAKYGNQDEMLQLSNEDLAFYTSDKTFQLVEAGYVSEADLLNYYQNTCNNDLATFEEKFNDTDKLLEEIKSRSQAAVSQKEFRGIT